MNNQNGTPEKKKTPIRKSVTPTSVRKPVGNRQGSGHEKAGRLQAGATDVGGASQGNGRSRSGTCEQVKTPVGRSAKKAQREESVVTPLPKYQKREADYKLKALSRSKSEDSVSVKLDPEFLKAREMAYLYEEALGIYRNQKSLTYFKQRFDPKNKTYKTFLRAAQMAEDLNVDYSIFLQAQFYWFDKWFRRPPKPFELRGERSKIPAPERVRRFLALKKSGEITEKHVTGMGRLVTKIDPTKLDAVNQRRLNSLMRAWSLSEEDVLIRFSRPGVDYFDADWLRRNPIVKKLRQQGKL